MGTSGHGQGRNRPTKPGRPAPNPTGDYSDVIDLTIYSVLDEGPDDTDPTPFSKPDPQQEITRKRCVCCGHEVDRDITPDALYRWLCARIDPEFASHIVASVLKAL